ncbi:hypothetical protein MT068_001373 [Salmonella enterica]|nr:hypothetical protein [Salmonella enterica]
MFTQQTIQVVADHELNPWDYSFKDLTATVQFKSMQLTFINDDELACKQFQGKLTEAKNIFGKARIPVDNLINALLAGGYKLVKTEVNRPSTTTMPRSVFESPIALLNTNDKRLVSEMHNANRGGTLSNTASYKVGEASTLDEWNKAGPIDLHARQEAAKQPEDAGVSRNAITSVYTINLSNPRKEGEFEQAIMAAFADMDKRGR